MCMYAWSMALKNSKGNTQSKWQHEKLASRMHKERRIATIFHLYHWQRQKDKIKKKGNRENGQGVQGSVCMSQPLVDVNGASALLLGICSPLMPT